MKAAAADATLPRFPTVWSGEVRPEAASAPHFIEEFAAEATSSDLAPVATDLLPPPGISLPPMGLIMATSGQGQHTTGELPDFRATSMPFFPEPVFAAPQISNTLDLIAEVTTPDPTAGKSPADDPPLGRNPGLPDDELHSGIPRPSTDGGHAAQVAALPEIGRASTSQALTHEATLVAEWPETRDFGPRTVQYPLRPVASSLPSVISHPEQAAPLTPDPVGFKGSQVSAPGPSQALSAAVAGLPDPQLLDAEPHADGVSEPAMRPDLLPNKQSPNASSAAPSTVPVTQGQASTANPPTQPGETLPESQRRLPRGVSLTLSQTGSTGQADHLLSAADPDGVSRQTPKALLDSSLLNSSTPEAPRAQALPGTELPTYDFRPTPEARLTRLGPEIGPVPGQPQGQLSGSSRPAAPKVASGPAETSPGPGADPTGSVTADTNAATPLAYPGAQESALRLLWAVRYPEGPPPPPRAARQDPVRLLPTETKAATPIPGQNANPVQPAFALPGQDGPEALSQIGPTSPMSTRAEPSEELLDHALGLRPVAPGVFDSARPAIAVKPDTWPFQHATAAPFGLERTQPNAPASMPLTRPDPSELAQDDGARFREQDLPAGEATRASPFIEAGARLARYAKSDIFMEVTHPPREPASPPAADPASPVTAQDQDSTPQIMGLPETDVARWATLLVAPEPLLKPATTELSKAVLRLETGAAARRQGDPISSPMRQASVALAEFPSGQRGRIELMLAPETLGRLHFDMRPEGAGLSITLSAERPETLELMRRHIPELIAELRQAGVQTGTLSFGAWSDGRHSPRAEKAEPDIGPAPGADIADVPPASHSHRAASSRGLDVRL